jgi:alpha-L-arabinofuranosidase
MQMQMKRIIYSVAGAGFVVAACPPWALAAETEARPFSITIQAGQPGAKINPAMWGIFFEDINFGADGGLYAEMVKNRGFEFPDPLMGWIKISPSLARGELTVRTDAPFDANNPHYVRLQSEGTAPFGISNEGFRGMGVRAGEAYDFSAQIRGVAGEPALQVQLYGGDGTLLDSIELTNFTGDWKKHPATLHPRDTDAKARLAVVLEGKGTLDLDFISLFPEHTWKNRPGGLRADMVQALADMHPGFLRFPGGCIVEGSVLERRYQWKNTLGPVEDRKLLVDRWNYEFAHRPTPDYYQSFGLGFFEYFQLCEDIGAEPLPILNCGMACQFNSGELCPLDQLGPYIQDALDLIEFANGPTTSLWGAKRAALGHPEPFNLKMLGVGNEQWGGQYIERYARFAKVLKEQHPEIMLVSAAGPDPADGRFEFAWSKLRELNADIIDEHCYARPDWFRNNTHRYDHYDRNGPKVFMGEYAAQSVGIVSTKNRNNLECALAEAAYMTGLERNADVVRMASYAPLFANVDAWQWTPDLIWVDSLQVYNTPNYYVQQLFSRNRGDIVLPTQISGTGDSTQLEQPLYATASRDDKTREIILKVVNPKNTAADAEINLVGVKEVKSGADSIVLAGAAPEDVNSFNEPKKISPVKSKLDGVASQFGHSFPPYSLTVLRLKEQ